MKEENEIKEQAHEANPISDELSELKNTLAEHGVRILTGVCVGLLIIGGASFYKMNKQSKVEKSSKMLSSARSLQDLQSLVAQYPSSPSAPLAMLKIAKVHYNTGNLDIAMNTYNDFMQKYPSHLLYLSAEMGKINCTEAKGEAQQALSAYNTFASEHPRHFLASQAVLGKARCLTALGRNQDAKDVYEEFIALNPNSEWLPLFEEKLSEIKTDEKVKADQTIVPAS